MPGECFPTRYRSTSHGISAASGKVRRVARRIDANDRQFGAIIAQIMAFQLKDRGGTNAWINHLLQIFALFMLTGLFASFLIPEVRRAIDRPGANVRRPRARRSRNSPARTRTTSSRPSRASELGVCISVGPPVIRLRCTGSITTSRGQRQTGSVASLAEASRGLVTLAAATADFVGALAI